MAASKTPKPKRAVGSKMTSDSLESPRIGPIEEVQHLPVIEESLEVSKEVVDRGGFRITKRVQANEQLVDELLRTEQVEIERRPINTTIENDVVPGIRQEGDTLIVPVIEERLVTVKRLVLVEEVRITRTKSTHREPQTYTLRKEHVEVERLASEQPPTGKSP